MRTCAKIFYHREQRKWVIACYVCGAHIDGNMPPFLTGYSTTDVVANAARTHLLSHAAGAIRP